MGSKEIVKDKVKVNNFVNLFFHMWKTPEKEGKPSKQGHVCYKIDDINYLVETYSWIDGSSCCFQIFTIQDLKDLCDFYVSSEFMKETYKLRW
jgi:predicted DNA-binding ArsR family transcriptional regulator